MSFLFGGTPPTTAELARRYKTIINRSVREIEREMKQVQAQERGYMHEIRKFAETNPNIARQKARAVARGRKTLSRFALMQSQMQEIGSRITGVKSAEALENALRSANRAMAGFHSRIGSKDLVTVIGEFEKNTNRMNQQSDIADDMLSSAFDGDENAEEDAIDDIVEAVLEEVGVSLPAPPNERRMTSNLPEFVPVINVADLEARLQRLRS